MTTIIPSNNRDLPDPQDGSTGDVPILQDNKTTVWGSVAGIGAVTIDPEADANEIVGRNSTGTAYEGKSLNADANTTISITHGSGSITLGSKTNTASIKSINTTPTTLLSTDPEDVWIDINAAAIAVTLPSAATSKYFRFKCYNSTDTSSSNQATISRAGSDLFSSGGGTFNSLAMSQGDTLEVRSDDITKWFVVSANIRSANNTHTGGSNLLKQNVLQHRNAAHTTTPITLTNGAVALSTSECVQYFNTSSNSITVNLPAIGGVTAVGSGKIFILVKTSALNSLTVDPNSTETIGGASTFTLTEDKEALAIQLADGVSSTDWKILWHHKPSLNLSSSTTVSSLPVTLTATSTPIQTITTAPSNEDAVTLPLASTVPGKIHIFNRNISTGIAPTVIARQGSDLIGEDSNTQYTFWGNQSTLVLQSDGVSRWRVLSLTPDIRGGFFATTASYTLASGSRGNGVIFGAYSTGASQTLNLYPVASRLRGKTVTIIKALAAGTGDVVITPSATDSDKIFANGAELTSLTLTERDETITLVASNRGGVGGWEVQSHYIPSTAGRTPTFAGLTSSANITVTGASGGSGNAIVLPDGAGDSTITIRSSTDHTANRILTIPPLGTADRSLIINGGPAQTQDSSITYSAAQVFGYSSGGLLRFRDTGDNHVYTFTPLGDETTGRLLNVPLLGQDATFAFKDFAQTWSAIQTHSADIVTTGATTDIVIGTAGGGLQIKTGTNATAGTATLVAGTVTIATTKVTANSIILVTSQVDGGTPGFLRVSARTAAQDFTVTSSDSGDTSTVGWFIVEPA